MRHKIGEDGYSKLKKIYESRHLTQNSLQILRQENRETVLVNALTFFLHPRRGGKFIDNQILKNLLKKTGKNNVKPDELLCITTEFPCFKLLEDSKQLELDSNTLSLDIFLEFRQYCMGIEVKVDASVYNDLDSYRKNVETRAEDGREREFDTLLLVRQNAKIKHKEGWKKITWKEITKNCNLIDGENLESQDSISDLLEALKDIDCGKSNEFSELEFDADDIEKKADELQSFLEKKNTELNSSKIFVWKGDNGLRHIIEPRVVVEDHANNFKIDICVGFRGIQFVIFSIKNYDTRLYERICKNYRFYYWQDYEDVCEHYKRYVIGKGEGNDGNGPLLPKTLSVEEEDTLIYKIDEDGLIEKVFNKTKELFEHLSN